ncbi:MAG TPA: hypothetical protein VLM11_16615 [Streptosporangiaceae bacterium]|nr:hypothetical protein [Streptosporangiaceae bacterium]
MPSHAGRGKGVHAAAVRPGSRRRRWGCALWLLAVATALMASIIITSGHPGTAALHLMLVLAVLAVLLAGQGYAVYRSSRRTSPRPRQQYFLFCAGYLIIAITGASAGGWADARHIGWLSNAMVWLAGLSLAGVLAMFGRGAFRGRLRRAFWRIPPPWLYQDQQAASSAAGRSDAEQPEPIPAAAPPTVADPAGDGSANPQENLP